MGGEFEGVSWEKKSGTTKFIFLNAWCLVLVGESSLVEGALPCQLSAQVLQFHADGAKECEEFLVAGTVGIALLGDFGLFVEEFHLHGQGDAPGQAVFGLVVILIDDGGTLEGGGGGNMFGFPVTLKPLDGTLDGVLLVIQKIAYVEEEFYIGLAVSPLVVAEPLGLELGESGFPISQDVGLDADNGGGFLDAIEQFSGECGALRHGGGPFFPSRVGDVLSGP